MERLQIDLGEKSYPIIIGHGLINKLGDFIGEADRWVIITDDLVDSLYCEKIYDQLSQLYKITKCVIPTGENNKNLSTVTNILNHMLDHHLTRNSKILAIGGGMVGDVAGFCGSIYMRGIDVIQVPTTLLAQVDSSVGGKTGINMAQGKNLVGTFHQPQGVIIDTATLETLSPREVLSGIGEVIKYGLIHDYSFLGYLKENLQKLLDLDQEVLKFVVKRCCEIKAQIVALDEREKGVRKILNFGHTLGHGIESVAGYGHYTHGEAVIIGMFHESRMAMELGLIDGAYFKEIQDLLEGFPIDFKLPSRDELILAMKGDKKNHQNKISFILPRDRDGVKEVLLTPEEIRSLISN